jgi:hypothetical protein
LMEVEVPGRGSAVRERVRARRMVPDDVVIVQGLGFVSQRDVAGMAPEDQLTLKREISRGEPVGHVRRGKGLHGVMLARVILCSIGVVRRRVRR